jgi:hypothetical protein
MDRPKWGTCGTTDGCPDGCRWIATKQSNQKLVCVRRAATFFVGNTATQPPRLHDNTCGEWEPVEGRVCGNCEWWKGHDADHEVDRNDPILLSECRIRSWPMDLIAMALFGDGGQSVHATRVNTCPAWRWCGTETKET